MSTPSNELKAMADAPKPETNANLIEWANLLSNLRIVERRMTQEGISNLLGAAKVKRFWAPDAEAAEDIFCLTLFPSIEAMIQEEEEDESEYLEHPLYVSFYDDGNAAFGDEEDENICEAMRPFRNFKGTWEEVARKLFGLEKLMLAQVPEVPGDLKS